jgi:Protein of unknown function (DUF3179)
VWKRTIDGRVLRFRLFGINNQNFIMRDEETGSWWQQVSGEAIQGPLRGRRLDRVDHDEIAFGLWKSERPGGRVLKPVAGYADDYASDNWERRMKKVRTVTVREKGDPLPPRTVIAGVTVGGVSKAYPFPTLRDESPLVDRVGGVPIVLVVGDDLKSIRVFARTVDGQAIDLFAKDGAKPLRMVDSQTGSEWDFSGTAVSGPLAGRQLEKLRVLKEYWFDWKIYQPASLAYTLGFIPPKPPSPEPSPSPK